MAEHIKRSHNVSLLIYHLVCPIKYRRDVLTKEVSDTLKTVCLAFGPAYDMEFLEIGTDEDHVHFLIQTVPSVRFSDLVKKIKSITAREIFSTHPIVKQKLWGGKFWTEGYYVNTVGKFGNLDMIHNYVKNQGIDKYEQIHASTPSLFD